MQTSAFPLLGCLLVWSLPAEPATLRTASTLQQPQVRIADLFDDAGSDANRILGPGPAPGGRIIVEAAQAAAIARQFGVQWRPTSPADRVVIDRPGRPPTRDDVLEALRPALQADGAAADADIEMVNFAPPLVALETPPRYTVEQLDFDPASGRFAATLSITANAEPMQRMRVSGSAVTMVDLVVPARRLPVGTVITPDDLQTLRVRATPSISSPLRGETAVSADQVLGKAVRRLALPGQPIPLADIGRPLAVLKGARVMLLLDQPGLSLAAIGIANEPGGIGDLIAVLNPTSGAIVQGEVIAADQVRVPANARPSLHAGSTQVSTR